MFSCQCVIVECDFLVLSAGDWPAILIASSVYIIYLDINKCLGM